MNIFRFLWCYRSIFQTIQDGKRDELNPSQRRLIFEASNLSTDICKNNICFFRSLISPWTGPQWKSLFRAFFLSMIYFFTMPKISLHWGPVQPFLNVDHNFGKNCFLKKLCKFFGTKFGSLPSEKMLNFLFGVVIEWETSVYFCPLFVLFKPHWPS